MFSFSILNLGLFLFDYFSHFTHLLSKPQNLILKYLYFLVHLFHVSRFLHRIFHTLLVKKSFSLAQSCLQFLSRLFLRLYTPFFIFITALQLRSFLETFLQALHLQLRLHFVTKKYLIVKVLNCHSNHSTDLLKFTNLRS